MNRIHSCFGFFKSESTYVDLCVSVRVNESLNEACEHSLLWCTSGYYLLSDWHSQPLVSDDRSTWRGTARSKRALAHRHTCIQTHNEPTQSSSSLNPSWNLRALPCHRPSLIKNAGREGRQEERRRAKAKEQEKKRKRGKCMCVCTAEQRQNRREGSGEEPTQESDGCAH